MGQEDDGQERSHEPTERRRQQFREKGEVPRSTEVTGTLGLFTALIVLTMFMQSIAYGIREVFAMSYLSMRNPDFDMASVQELTLSLASNMLAMLGAPMFLLWISAGLIAGIQGRGAMPKEPLKFELDKLNPLPGLKKIFMSSTPLVEAAKGLLKLGLIGWLVVQAVQDQLGLLPELAHVSIRNLMDVHFEVAKLVVAKALPVALVISVLDYAHQWWQLNERMMMTREEIKEENKDLEGDPHVRAARKARQREIANVKSVRNVKTADVVVTNPTHYAVALRYAPDEAPAPIVVARGVDHLAMKIKAEARAHDIPTIENRPLARALYAQSKAGEMIPEDLYGAVAQILAVILRRRAARKGGGARPRP